MRWGDELLDENNKERTELKKQRTGYRWISTRPQAHPPATHTDLGLAIKHWVASLLSMVRHWWCSQRAQEHLGQIPFGSSPAVWTTIPKRWAPNTQLHTQCEIQWAAEATSANPEVVTCEVRFWVSCSGGCAAWEPALSHTLPHVQGLLKRPSASHHFKTCFLNSYWDKPLNNYWSGQLVI